MPYSNYRQTLSELAQRRGGFKGILARALPRRIGELGVEVDFIHLRVRQRYIDAHIKLAS